MIPARPGSSVANAEQAKLTGDVVVAKDSNVGVMVAHQALIDDDEDGIKMIQVGSGTGILSIGSASYHPTISMRHYYQSAEHITKPT